MIIGPNEFLSMKRMLKKFIGDNIAIKHSIDYYRELYRIKASIVHLSEIRLNEVNLAGPGKLITSYNYSVTVCGISPSNLKRSENPNDVTCPYCIKGQNFNEVGRRI